jgi:calcineurin-like phosphoesterase family protein
MKIFFTADTHLGHSRIIEYSKRPFKDHSEMNKEILDRFNSRISKGDLLYHLGDVSWSSYNLNDFFGQLNCKQVQLILGNHDTKKTIHPSIIWRGDLKSISIEGQRIVLCHYPLRSWNHKGSGAFHLFGHCHNNLPMHDRSFDVGVDGNNFYPWSFEEIREKLKDIPMFKDNDFEHHRRDE